MLDMADNELLNIINQYVGETTTVETIKIGMICQHCGHSWGTSLNLNEPLINQVQRLACVPCIQEKINNRKEGNGTDENNKDKTQFKK